MRRRGAVRAPTDHGVSACCGQGRRAGMRRPHAMAPVMAADTAVALGGELFGKPADQADAARMLARLAGRTHAVWTAVAVTDGSASAWS